MRIVVPERSRHRVKIVHERTSPDIARELAALGIEMTGSAIVTWSDEPGGDDRRHPAEAVDNRVGDRGHGAACFPLDAFERRLVRLRRAIGIAERDNAARDRDTLDRYRRRAEYGWRRAARPRAADHYVAVLSDGRPLTELSERWMTSRPRLMDRRRLVEIGVPGFALDVLTAAQTLDHSNDRAQWASLDAWELVWSFLSAGRLAPAAARAFARQIVRVCEFHAALFVARTPLQSKMLLRDSLPDQVVLILGRLVHDYGAAANAETACGRSAAAAHFARLAVIVSTRVYGAASDMTAVCLAVWRTAHDSATVWYSGGRERAIAPVSTYVSLRYVVDDWLVRCDRERRRHRRQHPHRRSPAHLEELSAHYRTAARNVTRRCTSHENDTAPLPTAELSRLRAAAHVRDLAWRNLWFEILASAMDRAVAPSHGAAALAADSRTHAFWTDAVVDHVPIAAAWIRGGRRCAHTSVNVSRGDGDAGRDADRSAGNGDGGRDRCLSGRRRLIRSPITLKSVTWLLRVARLTVCDGWMLQAPVPRSTTPSPFGALSPPAISVAGIACILRAAAVEAAAGRVYAHLGRWRDAAGYLRRALDAMLKLHHCSHRHMHKSWRFFETCVHLLDALHAIGQHHSLAVLARRLKVFCSHSDSGAASAASGSSESYTELEIGAVHRGDGDRHGGGGTPPGGSTLGTSDRTLGTWSRRLSVQCFMVDCVRFFRATRAASFGESKRAVHAAEMRRQIAHFSDTLRALTWRGPIWRSVVAMRCVARPQGDSRFGG